MAIGRRRCNELGTMGKINASSSVSSPDGQSGWAVQDCRGNEGRQEVEDMKRIVTSVGGPSPTAPFSSSCCTQLPSVFHCQMAEGSTKPHVLLHSSPALSYPFSSSGPSPLLDKLVFGRVTSMGRGSKSDLAVSVGAIPRETRIGMKEIAGDVGSGNEIELVAQMVNGSHPRICYAIFHCV